MEEQKKYNLFDLMFENCAKREIHLIINRQGTNLTLVFFFKNANQDNSADDYIPPVTLTGTPEEIHDNFYDILQPGFSKLDSVMTNMDIFKKQIAAIEKKTEDKALEKAGKKSAKTNDAGEKKEPEKPKVGETANMFEAPAIEKPKTEHIESKPTPKEPEPVKAPEPVKEPEKPIMESPEEIQEQKGSIELDFDNF